MDIDFSAQKVFRLDQSREKVGADFGELGAEEGDLHVYDLCLKQASR